MEQADLHKLLERQLRHLYKGEVPPEVEPLIEAVDAAYRQADDDRALIERALDLSSEELRERNDRLRAELKKRAAVQEALERELAQRRQAEEDARRTMVRLNAAQRIAGLGYWEWDVTTGAAFWSPAVFRMFGYEADEVQPTRRMFLEHVHPEDMPILVKAFSQACEFELKSFYFRITRADGKERTVFVSGEVVYAEDEPIYAYGVIHDITEQKQYERALVAAKEQAEAAQQQAEEVFRMKSAFLNNMSHELRTPLAGIIGFAQVLEEEVGGEQREFITLIAQSARHLLGTFNSVLEFAQLESGALSLELDAVEMGAEVEEALLFLRTRAEEKGLYLRVERPGTPCFALVNTSALHRILTNLVGNAIKFTRQGGITIRVSPEGEHVVLKICDTGIGIEAAFLPHLFEEFRQASEGLDREHEGSGLGLAITKQMVEMMGGSIAVESTVGEGTTFTVRLQAASPRGEGPKLDPDQADPDWPAAEHVKSA